LGLVKGSTSPKRKKNLLAALTLVEPEKWKYWPFGIVLPPPTEGENEEILSMTVITWTYCHLSSEPLWASGLKEGAMGTVGE
jgi:hypothetical protein